MIVRERPVVDLLKRVAGAPEAINSAGAGLMHWSRSCPSSLLKLLALAPEHRLHREQRLDLLWPDLEATAAANNLHQVLHVARRALHTIGAGPGRLRWREELLSLPNDAVWVGARTLRAEQPLSRVP